MDIATINSILLKFPDTKGNLIGILHEVQNHFYYLPEEELRYLSKKTSVPITQIYSIVNFYTRFTLIPKGKNTVCVCLGTACHVKGGERVMTEFKQKLNIEKGGTTEDMAFSLEEVRCLRRPKVLGNANRHNHGTRMRRAVGNHRAVLPGQCVSRTRAPSRSGCVSYRGALPYSPFFAAGD